MGNLVYPIINRSHSYMSCNRKLWDMLSINNLLPVLHFSFHLNVNDTYLEHNEKTLQFDFVLELMDIFIMNDINSKHSDIFLYSKIDNTGHIFTFLQVS